MTQTRLKRAARAMKVVEKHTRTRDRISLMDLVEDSLARRAVLAAEIAVIDGQLGNVYERLAKDIPVRVADPTPAGLAEALAEKAAPAAPRRGGTRGGADVTQPVTADLRARVRAALQELQPVSLRGLANHVGAPLDTVKYHIKQMRLSGEVVATGATLTRAFSLATDGTGTQPPRVPHGRAIRPEPPAAAPHEVARRRTVVDDGVEFEPVWSGGKDAPSLLGDRTQRAGATA